MSSFTLVLLYRPKGIQNNKKCIDHVLKTIEIRNFYTSNPTKFDLFKDHL